MSSGLGKNMAIPVIDWPKIQKKLRRKGAWMPSDRAMERIADEVASEAAERMSLYFLYDRLTAEYKEAHRTSRPYLDDRKIQFYKAVIISTLAMIEEMEEDTKAAQEEDDVDMDYDSDDSSDYSGISSSDLPIPISMMVDTDMVTGEDRDVDMLSSEASSASDTSSVAANTSRSTTC